MRERAELTEKIEARKRGLGLSWREIASKIGEGSHVLYTAALKGQMTLTKEEASKAAAIFGLDANEEKLLTEAPYRGSFAAGPPSDPLIYRFYELVQVYGTTWKALIEEEFGDGIMSAIDFDVMLERQPDAKGDRVRITMSGKFLPYRRY
jgi:cyanate lyase